MAEHGAVAWVREAPAEGLGAQVRPDAHGLHGHVGLRALRGVVVEEGAVAARVQVLHQVQQVGFVELEGVRELTNDLPHAVDPLQEDRGALLVGVVRAGMPVPQRELVAERQPGAFHQDREPTLRAVVRVQHQLHESAQLRGAVPTEATTSKRTRQAGS